MKLKLGKPIVKKRRHGKIIMCEKLWYSIRKDIIHIRAGKIYTRHIGDLISIKRDNKFENIRRLGK